MKYDICKDLDNMFSSERWRGAWLSLFSLMVGVGILLVYTAGAGHVMS